MQGFEYPAEPHSRRHGPAGYQDYSSYRDWLRDEFTFRCVYCLHREQWGDSSGTFEIEHSVPVSVEPLGELQYTNLLYACRKCNAAKSNVLGVPDPYAIAFGDCLRINENGEVESLNDDGRRLRDVLLLNSPSRVNGRSRWMRTLTSLRDLNPKLYAEFLGFPDDLPDLRRKRVPSNTMPEGADNCYFALRERGELPTTY